MVHMKLQLDTKSKTITLEDDVEIKTLISTLKKMFPKNEWKDYKIKTNTTINNWSSPVIIRENINPWYWQRPHITWASDWIVSNYEVKKEDYSINSGIFNCEFIA